MSTVLSEVESRGHSFYFQYTINDYEQENLESGVPSLDGRIALFQELSRRYGKHRIIWRYDPIILGGTLDVDTTLKRIARLAEKLAPYTEKLVFSFVDLYKKTEMELGRISGALRAPTNDEMLQIAEGIQKIVHDLETPLKVATCTEDIGLQHLGISHNRCIDPELLLRLCPEQEEFKKFCGITGGRQQTMLPGLKAYPVEKKTVRDSGQRPACGCAPSKDIGAYDTCTHFCSYCYAVRSREVVLKKIAGLDPSRESLS